MLLLTRKVFHKLGKARAGIILLSIFLVSFSRGQIAHIATFFNLQMCSRVYLDNLLFENASVMFDQQKQGNGLSDPNSNEHYMERRVCYTVHVRNAYFQDGHIKNGRIFKIKFVRAEKSQLLNPAASRRKPGTSL